MAISYNSEFFSAVTFALISFCNSISNCRYEFGGIVGGRPASP